MKHTQKKDTHFRVSFFLRVECVGAPVLRNVLCFLNVVQLLNQFLIVVGHRRRSLWDRGPFCATAYRHPIADFTPVKTTRRTLETFKACQQQILVICPPKAMIANPHFPAGADASIRSDQVPLHKDRRRCGRRRFLFEFLLGRLGRGNRRGDGLWWRRGGETPFSLRLPPEGLSRQLLWLALFSWLLSCSFLRLLFSWPAVLTDFFTGFFCGFRRRRTFRLFLGRLFRRAALHGGLLSAVGPGFHFPWKNSIPSLPGAQYWSGFFSTGRDDAQVIPVDGRELL